MIAVDTNILVRLLARDHPEQATRAKAVVEAGPIFVPLTVILETAWVLRTTYGLKRDAIVAGLMKLLGLPHVTIENRPAVSQALEWCRQGLDLADALHLASSQPAEAFATFDRALRRKAARVSGTLPVVAP